MAIDERGEVRKHPLVKFQAQSWAHALCCDVGSGQASLLSRSGLWIPPRCHESQALCSTPREQRKGGVEGKGKTSPGLMSRAATAPESALRALDAWRAGDSSKDPMWPRGPLSGQDATFTRNELQEPPWAIRHPGSEPPRYSPQSRAPPRIRAMLPRRQQFLLIK